MKQTAVLITLKPGLDAREVAVVLEKFDDLLLSDERLYSIRYQEFDPDMGGVVIYQP